jgi:hypothetical protein
MSNLVETCEELLHFLPRVIDPLIRHVRVRLRDEDAGLLAIFGSFLFAREGALTPREEIRAALGITGIRDLLPGRQRSERGEAKIDSNLGLHSTLRGSWTQIALETYPPCTGTIPADRSALDSACDRPVEVQLHVAELGYVDPIFLHCHTANRE